MNHVNLYGAFVARRASWPLARVVAFCLVAAIFWIAVQAPPAEAQTKVQFQAGNSRGTWYRGLTALSECLRPQGKFAASVVPAQGGLEAHVRLQERGDIGFQFQSDLFPAWYGEGAYQGKQMRNLRAIGVAEAANYLQFVVRDDGKIKGLADLGGKKFAPGPLAGTTVEIVMELLKRVGVGDKIDRVNLTHSDMVNYFKDGKIDGWVLTSSLPSPALTEATVGGGARLLDVSKELDATKLLTDYPFFEKATIPAGTYPGIGYPVTTISLSALLVANVAVPEETVYQITKTLYSDACVESAIKSHPGLNRMAKGNNPLAGVIIPLHPGAARYWKERGLDTSATPTVESMAIRR